jgi:hypothetical protein
LIHCHLLPLLCCCSVHLQKAKAMAEHSSVPQLPQELVSQVLRNVGVRRRLASCSLVCKAWRAAAAAATSRVSLCLERFELNLGPAVDSLGQWLAAHGAGVTNIRIFGDASTSDVAVQLPYPTLTQLQQLHIHNCCLVQQPGGSSNAGTEQQQQQQQ